MERNETDYSGHELKNCSLQIHSHPAIKLNMEQYGKVFENEF